MKVAVIGSRDITGFNIAEILPRETTTLISGGARGVDSVASRYARINDIPIIEYLPDYGRYGRAAPLVRNRLIVDSCDLVIIIWNGQSRGTAYTLNYAHEQHKATRLFIYMDSQPWKLLRVE